MGKLIAAVVGMGFMFVTLIGLSFLFAFPVKWLWNYVMEGFYSGVPMWHLDIWHAWALAALAALCSMLFKSSVSKRAKE